MIDYEFRIITPTLRSLVSKKKLTEPTLINKIPKQHITINNLDKLNYNYFSNLKKINEILYRGLPINNKTDFINSELELEACFFDLKKKVKKTFKKNLIGRRIIQIPNPLEFSIRTFINFIKKNFSKTEYYGFELIPNWHFSQNKNISISDYDEFFQFIVKKKKPLCFESDFSFREYNNLYKLFYIIKKFPNIKILLPNLGAGIFLYDSFLKKLKLKNRITIYTSAPNSLEWLFNVKKNYLLKNTNIYFGSDHPFNGDNTVKIYNAYNKWKNND
jgi:hypothetical protein